MDIYQTPQESRRALTEIEDDISFHEPIVQADEIRSIEKDNDCRTDITKHAVPVKAVFIPEEWPAFSNKVYKIQCALVSLYAEYKVCIWLIVNTLCLLAYLGYFSYAMYFHFGDEGSIRLLVYTVIGLLILTFRAFRGRFNELGERFEKSCHCGKTLKIVRWILYVISLILTVTLIIVLLAKDNPKNLVSLAGLAAFILLGFLTSHNPAMVNWHPVFWGFSLQFYFAVFILKTSPGFELFSWLEKRVTELLSFSNAGSKFIFGDTATLFLVDGSKLEIRSAYLIHMFAFKIMPFITFFSSLIAILYHLGVMQATIRVIGRSLSFCLCTTPAESICAAGNIFVSMTESPLLIRPFIPKMTTSELHAVMCAGFATMAGGVLGVYMSFGVPAKHLLSASVMSAPAALAISKLTYPEDEISILDQVDDQENDDERAGSVIEAACNGALRSSGIIAAVLVNIIAFTSVLEMFNVSLEWFASRIGVHGVSFELLCSYLLYPVALFMGTELQDCRMMAELVGMKTFTNEFVAYTKLKKLQENRRTFEKYTTQHGSAWHHDGDDIVLENNGTRLVKGVLSLRSESIATYALCGFSNFASAGMFLGSLTSMAPNREATLSKIVFRAMIAGNVACFCTACIAGLFFEAE